MLATAAKVGLTGHVVVATPDEARRNALAARALAAGALVETESDIQASANDSFDVAILDLRGSDAAIDAITLASLHRRLRQGGRLIMLMSAPGGGLSALFGGGGTAPDTTAQTTALLAAGFRTARVLAVRDGIVFIESMKS